MTSLASGKDMESLEDKIVAHGPTLGQAQALSLLVLYCVVYVLPLYASAATRPSPTRSRDAPEAIRARIRSVSFSTAACSVTTLLIFFYNSIHASNQAEDSEVWHVMGYWPLGLREATSCLSLTALLFAGPLYECLFIDGVWQQWLHLEPLRDIWVDWPTWRNMIAGPVTEECLFRSAAIPLLLLSGSSIKSMVFLSPLVFGLAHLHHFYEFRLTHPQIPLLVAVARSLLQLTYTSLFGAYATFLFLRTGSLLAIISVHSFCNAMGLPRLGGFVEPYWLPSQDRSPKTVLYTAIYYLLLLGGTVAWWRNLYTLTDTSLRLTSF